MRWQEKYGGDRICLDLETRVEGVLGCNGGASIGSCQTCLVVMIAWIARGLDTPAVRWDFMFVIVRQARELLENWVLRTRIVLKTTSFSSVGTRVREIYGN